MRIAFATPEYITEPNYDGGLANYLYRVSTALVKLGHEVEVFTSSAGNERLIYDGIMVHRVRHRTLLWKIAGSMPLLSRLRSTTDIILRSKMMEKAFLARHCENPFDIVQSASYMSPTVLWRNNNIPIITRVSSFTPLVRGAYGLPCSLDAALVEWLEARQMLKSTAVYSPSQLIAQEIARFHPVAVDVIRPPFIGVVQQSECDAVNDLLPAGLDYMLFYGTIGRLKGISFIWRNLPRILRESPNLSFVFIGKGSLPALGEDLQPYANRVVRFNSMRHNQLMPIIQKARAVVLPSIVDNFPNACLESMYRRKVVISTRGSSCDEIIQDGISGFLVNFDDDDGFCNAVRKVAVMTPEELDVLGSKAWEQVSSLCDWNRQIAELVAYYEQAGVYRR